MVYGGNSLRTLIVRGTYLIVFYAAVMLFLASKLVGRLLHQQNQQLSFQGVLHKGLLSRKVHLLCRICGTVQQPLESTSSPDYPATHRRLR